VKLSDFEDALHGLGPLGLFMAFAIWFTYNVSGYSFGIAEAFYAERRLKLDAEFDKAHAERLLHLTKMHIKAAQNCEDLKPDKQCQGCGAFGKGHRCFYCKRTYPMSSAEIARNTQSLLYAPLNGGEPVWLTSWNHSAVEVTRMVDDASSWAPPYKYINPITLDATGK
jgi:hypothetical protein